ncbi:hypothetical protein A8924_5358 [Saccharopolyspora erythraea NRRL 2338]|uniref:Uncharacterized protein n=2 Tax=Saccharopolyspora erythraea TaxID=1836 RepID=A4FJL5_SACEN|nr:hypothetical protein [Saccharopolyspora erythraea]EQD82663.1 hypothetical protein N599_29500 [Saccharopolyspora erythraea D]PFG97889.1 hypothetical protein A8924_5358 [Saccharopolyspora erythraea NRRL 2338]CAM04240.1 hypothetical protein SACE_4976 [Saccharopolyspora erythraea NRRL 2338]
MGSAVSDMAVAQQPEGTLLTATEAALAAELETDTTNLAPEDA